MLNANVTDINALTDDAYVSIPEAAKLLRISSQTVRRLVNNGDIPAIVIFRDKFITGGELKKIIQPKPFVPSVEQL